MRGAPVLARLLPTPADNRVRGHPLALWLFAVVTVLSLARSAVHVLRADGGAQSIATIPLDRFTPEGAATVVAMFGQWGVSQLVLAVVFVVVLVRYRALVPLMYGLLLLEHAGRLIVGAMKPVVAAGTPPGRPGSVAMVVVALAGLALSLRGDRATGAPP